LLWTVREFNKEGVPIDLDKLMPEKGPGPILPESGEAFIYVAMSRLMARRLARS
jgi:hypothetical protein